MQELRLSILPKELYSFRESRKFQHQIFILYAKADKVVQKTSVAVFLPFGIFEACKEDPKIGKGLMKWMCSGIRGSIPGAGCMVCGRSNKKIITAEAHIDYVEGNHLFWLVCAEPACSSALEGKMARFSDFLEKAGK